MEKTTKYYIESHEDYVYFDNFYKLANYLGRDKNELWSSYIAGDEQDIHSKTVYTNFTIKDGENFTGNRRRYFEDFCEAEAGYVDDEPHIADYYLMNIPSPKLVMHLIKKAFGINNRIEYIKDYIFIVLPKNLCSIVTKINDYDRESGDIGYYYLKTIFDAIIKSKKNSAKYPIQSKIFYAFEPWEYIDRNGYVVSIPWYKHYSTSLEMDRLK